MGQWRTAAMVVVVVVVMGTLEGVQLEEEKEPSLSKFWPSPEVPLNLSLWFSNPTQRTVDGMSQILLESSDPQLSFENIGSMYLPSLAHGVVHNWECKKDLIGIIQVLNNENLTSSIINQGRLWPLTLFDSWGKVPDGILYGNVMPWGMQQECTRIHVNEHVAPPAVILPINLDFMGRYCLVRVGYMEDPQFERISNDPSKAAPQVGIIMAEPEVPPIFSYGTCMPSSCTPEDLQASIDYTLEPVGKMAVSVDCHLKDEVIEFNAGDIVFIVILSVLGVILLSAATVDLCINYFDKEALREGPLKFLLAFSAYTNMKKIFEIKTTEHPDVISCLHGMRVLSMGWVVWCHSYMLQVNVTNNLGNFQQLSDDVLDQIVVNGSFSVDTFLFMGGLVLTYSILVEKDKSGTVNWIMYYVNRFFRLAPPIMFTAAGMATVFRFGMGGPYAGQMERFAVQNCRNNWWADAIFLSNFLDNCLPQCWYTAVDFQLFIVAPFVLAPLLTRSIFGLGWLALITMVSIAVPMINIAVYDLTPSLPFLQGELSPKAMVDIYMKPWCRASPYLVGIWGGWLLYTLRGKKIKLNLLVLLVGWLVSAAIALAVLLGMAEYNVFTLKDPVLVSRAVSILYGGLSRLAWGVALLWVVFVCHTGNGGIANSILSHPSLQPLSRLTYCLFLTTVPVQLIYMGAIYLPLYINHLNKVIECCGYMFIAGLISVPLSLAVERPIMELMKILFPRPGRSLVEQLASEK